MRKGPPSCRTPVYAAPFSFQPRAQSRNRRPRPKASARPSKAARCWRWGASVPPSRASRSRCRRPPAGRSQPRAAPTPAGTASAAAGSRRGRRRRFPCNECASLALVGVLYRNSSRPAPRSGRVCVLSCPSVVGSEDSTGLAGRGSLSVDATAILVVPPPPASSPCRRRGPLRHGHAVAILVEGGHPDLVGLPVLQVLHGGAGAIVDALLEPVVLAHLAGLDDVADPGLRIAHVPRGVPRHLYLLVARRQGHVARGRGRTLRIVVLSFGALAPVSLKV